MKNNFSKNDIKHLNKLAWMMELIKDAKKKSKKKK